MKVAEKFVQALQEAPSRLHDDEWALTSARKNAVTGLSSAVAFESIVDVLSLALSQSEPYFFASCLWLALDLAERSDTTQRPEGLEQTLLELLPVAQRLKASDDLAPLLAWYRLPPHPSFPPPARTRE